MLAIGTVMGLGINAVVETLSRLSLVKFGRSAPEVVSWNRPTTQSARRLVLRHGWNATAYQILNPGISHWFSAAGDAVVGYVVRKRVRVVAGAPVCAIERLPDVTREFERDADDSGQTVCYFCAEARLESHYRGTNGYSMVQLGSQPAWDPVRWPQIVRGRPSLRGQLNRAHNKGVAIERWFALSADNITELQRCLDQWLSSRGLPPLHFLVEPETLSHLADRRVFVARRGGNVIGFLLASPIPKRNGWLVEQNVRGPSASNGTSELLLDAVMRSVAADGATYVTLGLAPLSNLALGTAAENPLWLRVVLGWIRAHGRRFYNFEGLESFKAKFQPDSWEPVYAISNEARFSVATLYAIAAAFSEGPPAVLILRGILKAIRTEVNWLLGR
ncbi:MAG: DUF2156 domain-containing protein [Pyrinomonadaceae bacterium]